MNQEAKKKADELANAGTELRERGDGVKYIITKEPDSEYFSVRRADGKRYGKYAGTWDAEQILRLFEPAPTLAEDLARFNAG